MTKRIGRPKGDGTHRNIGVYGTEQEIAAVLDILTPRQRMEALLKVLAELDYRDDKPATVDTSFAQCEYCGTSDNLTWAPNPYAHEINDDDTPVWLCQGCREELAADI